MSLYRPFNVIDFPEWKSEQEIHAMCIICCFTGRKLQYYSISKKDWIPSLIDVGAPSSVKWGGHYRLEPLPYE